MQAGDRSAVQILEDEHVVIRQVLDCLEKLAEQAAAEGSLRAEEARQALDFLRNYADRFHHAKEEDQLFPLLEERGLPPETGPTAVMRAEHVRGREMVSRMQSALAAAAAGKDADLGTFVSTARSYVELLRDDIDKENHCLFPMAGRLLNDKDQTDLIRSFARADRMATGPGTDERYRRLADALAGQLGVAPRTRPDRSTDPPPRPGVPATTP